MSKPAGRCIFCGEGDLSKEHIFPKWIQPMLGVLFSHTDHQIKRFGDAPEHLPMPRSHRPYQQGDPLVHKLRVVCQGCNGGWMSQLQTAAKPILKHLIFANWTRLGADHLPVISAWVAMSTMVWEYADPATAFVSQGDREDLRKTGLPPKGWHIFMAKYHGLQDRFHLHTALEAVPKPALEHLATRRGQITTIGLGQLAFIALTEIEEEMGNGIRDALAIGSGYVRIWPSLGVTPIATRTIMDTEIRQIHGDLLRSITGKDPDLPVHRPPVFND